MSQSTAQNRRVLLLIAGIPLAIILAATSLWWLVDSGRLDLVGLLGTANRGELLLQPVDLGDFEPVAGDGKAFDPAGDASPLWRIVIPGGPHCDAECDRLLHYTRQIHTAMGKYQNRIERVYLSAGGSPGSEGAAQLARDYPELKVLYTAAGLSPRLEAAVADGVPPGYLVMDPQGWMILAYSADADGKDLMADLKFLLKNSSG